MSKHRSSGVVQTLNTSHTSSPTQKNSKTKSFKQNNLATNQPTSFVAPSLNSNRPSKKLNHKHFKPFQTDEESSAPKTADWLPKTTLQTQNKFKKPSTTQNLSSTTISENFSPVTSSNPAIKSEANDVEAKISKFNQSNQNKSPDCNPQSTIQLIQRFNKSNSTSPSSPKRTTKKVFQYSPTFKQEDIAKFDENQSPKVKTNTNSKSPQKATPSSSTVSNLFPSSMKREQSIQIPSIFSLKEIENKRQLTEACSSPKVRKSPEKHEKLVFKPATPSSPRNINDQCKKLVKTEKAQSSTVNQVANFFDFETKNLTPQNNLPTSPTRPLKKLKESSPKPPTIALKTVNEKEVSENADAEKKTESWLKMQNSSLVFLDASDSKFKPPDSISANPNKSPCKSISDSHPEIKKGPASPAAKQSFPDPVNNDDDSLKPTSPSRLTNMKKLFDDAYESKPYVKPNINHSDYVEPNVYSVSSSSTLPSESKPSQSSNDHEKTATNAYMELDEDQATLSTTQILNQEDEMPPNPPPEPPSTPAVVRSDASFYLEDTTSSSRLDQGPYYSSLLNPIHSEGNSPSRSVPLAASSPESANTITSSSTFFASSSTFSVTLSAEDKTQGSSLKIDSESSSERAKSNYLFSKFRKLFTSTKSNSEKTSKFFLKSIRSGK